MRCGKRERGARRPVCVINQGGRTKCLGSYFTLPEQGREYCEIVVLNVSEEDGQVQDRHDRDMRQ